ncbi:MAG TPA: Lrp/AsnC ligand binding domain-containing protein [Nitrososphaera sp.]|nr:Lrp/AsnC ligand binding domain-containing protein [Nitrososphaera sp.]
MPGAYVMINTLPGMEKPVLEEIAQIPGVVSVEGVYGEIDLIVRLEVPVGNSVGFVIDKIRKVPGIKSTKTISTIDGERKSGVGMDYLGPPSD